MVRLTQIALGMLVVLFLVATASATKLILNDGTTIEGTVIRSGDDYWVKTSDGQSKTVAVTDVKSVIEATTTQPDSAGASADLTGESQSIAFRSAYTRATDATSAMQAVVVWQDFITRNPNSPDLTIAKNELARWRTLADQNAEKINGKWVSGDDRQKIITQANELTNEGLDMIRQNQTLKAVAKLQEANKVYPNSYATNFALGYLATLQKDYDSAVQDYTAAMRLRPQSIETLNNLAVANFEKGQYEAAINGFQKAAEIQDSQVVAQNLYNALALCPASVRDLPRLKPAQAASNLLASKYDITTSDSEFGVMHPAAPRASAPNSGESVPPPAPDNSTGSVWSGTGFFIGSDGLILTNRHVARGANNLLIMMQNGDTGVADPVVIDDNFDLALLRLRGHPKTPFVHFAPANSPTDGADCVVMGFPLMERLGTEVKVTRGIVSSGSADEGFGADVLTDAKVNPGNSGGPIIDKHGNVMAIICMKSLSTAMEDSYGIGIGAGHIREFLKRNKVSTDPGSTDKTLSTEDIVAQIKPATVCILATK